MTTQGYLHGFLDRQALSAMFVHEWLEGTLAEC